MTKCDGNHGGPQCGDPECWNGGEPQGDPIYEMAADMMGRSICAGAIPRHVVLRKLREHYPNPAVLRQVIADAAVMAHEMAKRGMTAVGYDAEELARIQREQRNMK
jgi:hypothetical protein